MAKKRLELSPIRTIGIEKANKEIHEIITWLSEAEIEQHPADILIDLQIQGTKFLARAVRSLMFGNFRMAQKLAKIALATIDQLKED